MNRSKRRTPQRQAPITSSNASASVKARVYGPGEEPEPREYRGSGDVSARVSAPPRRPDPRYQPAPEEAELSPIETEEVRANSASIFVPLLAKAFSREWSEEDFLNQCGQLAELAIDGALALHDALEDRGIVRYATVNTVHTSVLAAQGDAEPEAN